MTNEMIRTVTHPQGDWYVVANHPDVDHGSRWFIDRVVLWAVRSGEQMFDHVIAVDSTGAPDSSDQSMDRYFVLGTDSCPDGRTWNEVFRSVRPSPAMAREITEQGRKWEESPDK